MPYTDLLGTVAAFMLFWNRKDLTKVWFNRLHNLLAKPLHIP
jgi:hypothetical protein